MRIEIPESDTGLLTRLAAAAGLSRALWVRAAIQAASEDSALAQRILKAAPASEHGGHRPGAGRPRLRGKTQKKTGGSNDPAEQDEADNSGTRR